MRLLSFFLGLFLMVSSSSVFAHIDKRDLTFIDKKGTEQIIHFEDIQKLPQYIIETSTPWHEGVQKFEGPLLRDVIALFNEDVNGINAIALNDFSSNVPEDDYMNYNVLLAWKHNGKEMSRRELGPYFIVYPYDSIDILQDKIYYSRSVWQIIKMKSIEFED